MASSETARGQGGGGNRPPRGDGNDPMTLRDLAERDDQSFNKGIQGKPPKDFEGDQSETCQFLTQFKQFMRLNLCTEIANNPISKVSYFLTLIRGPQVDGWTEEQDHWLEEVLEDPSILPCGMNAWDVMEQAFKSAFIDYAEQEHAQDEIHQLRMKDGRIDEYISAFRRLCYRASNDPDGPFNTCMFARGLPHALAMACIHQD